MGKILSKTLFSVIIITGFLFVINRETISQETRRPQKTFTSSIGIEFLLIPAGSFIMGEALRTECDTCNAARDETPRHKVRISRPFYISKYEVTQEQWLAVMDTNPSYFKGDQRPVENLSWTNAQLFIYALNFQEKTKTYRLPTEAEWEYAARSGTKTAYSFGDSPSDLVDYGWYVMNSNLKSYAVGQLEPNAWGLYDMHGNVFEWCQDRYKANYYYKSPAMNPSGPSFGDGRRVRRGGYWGSSARKLRSCGRDSFLPDVPASNTGFRLVKDLN